MNLGVAFAPLISTSLLWAAIAIACLLSLLLFVSRSRGAVIRTLALGLVVLALANPSLTREHRDPLNSVAVVVVDKSPSQNFGDRMQQTEAARAAVVERLHHIAGLDVRVVDAGQADGQTDGTRLFSALTSALADVPSDRVAGVIMITDGRVHDVPADASALGFAAPLHALITGNKNERDRRVALIAAPRFGIVGQPQTITYRVEDQGAKDATAQVTVRRDGEMIDQRTVPVGTPQNVTIPIPHGGANIVEIEASPLANELTQVNNRAVVTIDGVRDKLRVLLVSGEPHAGERTWRNLLKSDPSVDLVHFTILRPPEKQDGTPINELSLIAFPTRELFQQKIKEFQLIIFDRYAQQGVLPIIYFDNIVNYVRDGGAVLVAAGADYASPNSIFHSPLETLLPAEPTGNLTEAPFQPRLTDAGKRHPVTRALPGADFNPPHWSHWFRLINARAERGTALMSGPDDNPLLVLSRYGDGRVALLLSDHIWLWARGFEGGGPHLDLLRRLSHWLMKQPELEEERLLLSVQGGELMIDRRTMQDAAVAVNVATPSGVHRAIDLPPAQAGFNGAATPASELGLWRATDGTLTALVNVGPINPREYAEVTSTKEVVEPLTSATGGGVWRIDELGAPAPHVVGVRSGERFAGADWLGLKMREASTLRGLGLFPLFAGLSGLLILLAGVAAAWAREGR